MTHRNYASDPSTRALVLAVIVLFLSVVPLAIYNGWVVSVLWNWFIPPTFVGMSSLSIAKAIGLTLVVGVFLNIRQPKDETEYSSLSAEVIVALGVPLARGIVFLISGWLVHAIAF